MGKITRRDFLNGTQVAIGTSLLSPWTQAFGTLPDGSAGFSLSSDYYPPKKTGLRGSHDGSWETMHSVVANKQWSASSVEEEYDLVVVGAGISGLSAAYYYHRENPTAKILVLDNHDDFGGHAKRNEFQIGDRLQIAYGGTEAIDTPSDYPEVAQQLLKDIGIDVNKFYDYYHHDLYDDLNMGMAVVFDQKTFGQHKVAVGFGSLPWEEFVEQTPLSKKAKADLVRVFTEEKDYLLGLTREEKTKLLSSISYYDFLKDYVKVDHQILEMYRRWGISFWCVGIEEIPAIAIQVYDDGGDIPGLSHTLKRVGTRGDEPYIFHFPDGNASIARLLVRQLIPQAVPGSTMEDVVTAKVDYSLLDQPANKTQLRLNSTAVEVKHVDDNNAVDVTYVRDAKAHRVRAKQVVMACYNGAIPYLCPDIPKQQAEGLAYGVKIPLTYTKVAIKNWQAFVDLGVSYVFYTKDFYKQIEFDYPVSMGEYQFAVDPKQPMNLHMCHVPYFKDISGADQWRAGRRAVLATPFETFEHHAKDQIDQVVGSHGFDVDRDIHAITVNRWPHGYAYNPKLIWEPQYSNDKNKPWVIGRQRCGRIAIANSDAGADADTGCAIEQAHRAVYELLEEYA